MQRGLHPSPDESSPRPNAQAWDTWLPGCGLPASFRPTHCLLLCWNSFRMPVAPCANRLPPCPIFCPYIFLSPKCLFCFHSSFKVGPLLGKASLNSPGGRQALSWTSVSTSWEHLHPSTCCIILKWSLWVCFESSQPAYECFEPPCSVKHSEECLAWNHRGDVLGLWKGQTWTLESPPNSTVTSRAWNTCPYSPNSHGLLCHLFSSTEYSDFCWPGHEDQQPYL